MIRFSIVTVCFQAQKVIQPTLDSVAAQTYDNVEHLIIDGASKDDTLSLIRAYQEKSAHSSHQVNILSEPDKGIYDAMNKALERVSGDYVCFLNAGDCLPHADTLKDIALKVEEKGKPIPAVIYGDTDIIDAEGRVVGHRHLKAPKCLSWRSFREGMTVCHQAFYADVRIAKEVAYDMRYRYSADVDWCIRVMKEAERQKRQLMNMEQVIAYFLSDGMTAVHHRESLKERFHIMCRHYGITATVGMHAWFALRALARKVRK